MSLLLVMASPLRAQPPASSADAPLLLVVPFAAGGPTDALARQLAGRLGEALGRPVQVQARPGLGGTEAPSELARNAADGRTVLLHHIGMATAPTLFRRLTYDPQRDFVPLGLVADAPMVVLVRQSLPVHSMRELALMLRRQSGTMSMAYAGVGAASHLCGLLLASVLQIDPVSVPYKGTGPALKDLEKGVADLMCDQTTATLDAIRAGRVRALAVTTQQRLDVLPDVPTTREAGLPGLQLSIWHGLYAPRETAPALALEWSRALQRAVAHPAFLASTSRVGVLAVAPEQATQQAHRIWLSSQTARWRPLIQRSGQFAD